MDPQLIKNVLSLPIMIMMVLVFLIVIAVSITNTIYYKKLWEENGSESISEESAKVFFFVNLFLAIICGIVFFVFSYRWYKIYNISNMEIDSTSLLSPSQTKSSRMFSPIPDDRNKYSSPFSPLVQNRNPCLSYNPPSVGTVLDFDDIF